MKVIKNVIGISALLWCAIANAAIVESSAFTIQNIRISDSSGNAYIDPVGSIQAINTSCTDSTQYGFVATDSLFDQHYSTALAAFLAGKQIKVWISDVYNDCVNARQRVRSIQIQ